MKQVFSIMIMLLLMAAPALAEDTETNGGVEPLHVEMYPLDSLKAGQKGIGHTVIRGTEVETFNVEVLELVPQGGFDGGPLILARFTGEVVEFSNGIAGGYSGSPVYIGDKLLGAVSMAIPFTDTHIGGITPIQQMLAALPDTEEVDYSGNTVLPFTDQNGTTINEDGERIDEDGYRIDEDGNRIAFTFDWEAARAFNDEQQAQGSELLAAVPAQTPFYFSGISASTLDQFGDELRELLGPNAQLMERPMGKAADYGLFLRDDAGSTNLLLDGTAEELPLKAGDAVVVSYLQGDLEFYGVGTVTYSDSLGRFLAFGHPMSAVGETNFPVGKGYITWTYESIQRAFKDGVRLNNVGTMTRDQGAACGGSFNIEPDMIPVSLKIKDIDTGLTEKLNFDVIRDPDLTPMILSMAMAQGTAQTLDRRLSGTIKFSYKMEGVGLKEPLRRTNYYYDDFDVVSQGAWELMPVAMMLETNIYRDVDLTDIDLMIEITRNRINASIDDAEIIMEEVDQSVPELTGEETTEEDAISAIEEFNEYVKEMTGKESAYLPGPVSLHPDTEHSLQQDGASPEPEDYVDDVSYYNGYASEVPTFAPGDTIRVKVRLQPYRTDAIWREFAITVPDDFPSGSTMLVVHGGGNLVSMSELGGKGRSLYGMGPVIELDERDLDSILTQIIEWPLNNELLITLERPYDPAAAQELGNEDAEVEQTIDAKYQMEWVIYNGFYLPVEILTEEDRAMIESMSQEVSEEVAAEEAADDDEEEFTNYKDYYGIEDDEDEDEEE